MQTAEDPYASMEKDQLISMIHFLVKREDEHWCYFDDWYSPDYSMKLIYDAIMKYDIYAEAAELLKAGHKEIQKTECYDN